MVHKLPELSYDYDALEPYIDSRTMEIHHQKHHGAYVSKLNAALEGFDNIASKPLETILRDLKSLPESIAMAVRNNGGGHFNHTIFWEIMSPNAGGEPKGDVANAIKKHFGAFEKFKAEFANAATNSFGSGWAWLVFDNNHNLKVVSTPNQDNPVSEGFRPIMGIDVWEHAYYLKYQNRRPEYIENWWKVVNWDKVNERFISLSK